jgi:hypothetical protein
MAGRTRQRPKKAAGEDTVREAVIPVRVTPEEKATIERKASRRHRGASTWLRTMGLDAPEDPPASS